VLWAALTLTARGQAQFDRPVSEQDGIIKPELMSDQALLAAYGLENPCN
jgi:hypothetical protein